MNFDPHELSHLLALARLAAQEASAFIAAHKLDPHQIQKKHQGTSLASQVLTEVDLQSQSIIHRHLEPTLKSHDLAILSEETPDDGSRFEKQAFWCIDPLDGTLPFVEGEYGFAVSIALVSKTGIPFLAVVCDPTTQSTYHAIIRHGARKDGQSLFVPAKRADLENSAPITLFADRSQQDDDAYLGLLDRLQASLPETPFTSLETRFGYGAVLNALSCLDSSPACYCKLPKTSKGGGSLWDFAATSLILDEAKAYARNCLGDRLDLNRPDSTFLNHQGILFASDESVAHFVRSCF